MLRNRISQRPLVTSLLSLTVVLTLTFLAAEWTRDLNLFSLSPPGTHVPDITESQKLDLHRTFFTAWAAILLITPAFSTFWFRRSSNVAGDYWLAFWTAGFIAFLVHFYWAVFVIFEGDWHAITHTSRVSAAIPDMVVTIWWAADVSLAWSRRSESRFIGIQRTLVHLFAFVLFFMGSVKEGELLLSKIIGLVMAISTIAAFIFWRIKARAKLGVIPR